jgi:hypothetical protein
MTVATRITQRMSLDAASRTATVIAALSVHRQSRARSSSPDSIGAGSRLWGFVRH